MTGENRCLENVRKIDPNGVLCSNCEQFQQPNGILYRFCHCLPPYQRNPCPFGPLSPVAIYESDKLCFCCCSSSAYSMPVASPEHPLKAAETYGVGDTLLAGNADLTFYPATVAFSDGLPPGIGVSSEVLAVYFRFPDGGEEFLVVPPDHVFLTEEAGKHKLRRANLLLPHVDRLVLQDGQTALILAIELGAWDGGFHHVATSAAAATSADGHLIVSKQVVCGDWALQVSAIPDEAEPSERMELFAAEDFQVRHEDVDAEDIDVLRPQGFRRPLENAATVFFEQAGKYRLEAAGTADDGDGEPPPSMTRQ